MLTIKNVCNPYDLHNRPELQNATVHYVMYNINTIGRLPFLTFYLVNNTNTLSFPKTTETHCIPHEPDHITHIYKLMKTYDVDISQIHPRGYVTDYSGGLYDPTNIYIFYEIDVPECEPMGISSNQLIWPVFCWEIFKTGKVLNKLIDVNVIQILHTHTNCLSVPISNELTEDDPKYSDILYPMVGYSLHPRNHLSFSSMFGVSRKVGAEYGDYYYYYRNIDSIAPDLDPSTSYGVVRYIIYNNTNLLSLEEFKKKADNSSLCVLGNYILSDCMSNALPVTYHLL
jgi:hypothetical protein